MWIRCVCFSLAALVGVSSAVAQLPNPNGSAIALDSAVKAATAAAAEARKNN